MTCVIRFNLGLFFVIFCQNTFFIRYKLANPTFKCFLIKLQLIKLQRQCFLLFFEGNEILQLQKFFVTIVLLCLYSFNSVSCRNYFLRKRLFYLCSRSIILFQKTFIRILLLLQIDKNTLLLNLFESLKLVDDVLTQSLIFSRNVIETCRKISEFVLEGIEFCFHNRFFGITIHHHVNLLIRIILLTLFGPPQFVVHNALLLVQSCFLLIMLLLNLRE